MLPKIKTMSFLFGTLFKTRQHIPPQKKKRHINILFINPYNYFANLKMKNKPLANFKDKNNILINNKNYTNCNLD